MTPKILKAVVKAANAKIALKASALSAYRTAKATFFKSTGKTVSKELYQTALSHKIGYKAAEAIGSEIKGASKAIKALKKIRKRSAEGLIFRRVGGRLIPIRKK